MQKKYKVCSGLEKNPARFCASLLISPKINLNNPFWFFKVQNIEKINNGTLTFVKSNGRVYGITAWHIINSFREKNNNDLSLYTIVEGFNEITDNFINPTSLIYGHLDVAIAEISQNLLNSIGKKALDLDIMPNHPDFIKFGYAIGFPTKMKYKKLKNNGKEFQVSLPQFQILAEIEDFPKTRFALFSNKEIDLELSNFSGISGGPVFWSTPDEYGIMGIIYETLTGKKMIKNSAIHIKAELALPNEIETWIQQLH